MRKNALTISCYVGALGAFGAFFRWLQLQSAFDKETGLLVPSALNVILPLILIGAAVLFYFLVNKLKGNGYDAPADVHTAFRGTSIFYPIGFYAIAVITGIGGLAAIISAPAFEAPAARILVGLIAILCAVTFPLICTSSRKQYMPSLVCIFMTLPIVMYCIWLVACYKVNADTPTIWAYCVEIITVCAVIVAFYYTAGYPYGSAKPYKALYYAILAAFLCIVSLADSRGFGLQAILAGTAGMLIMEACMIICNMQESVAKPEKPAEEKKPEPEEKPVEKAKVIDAGVVESIPEPTIQAPDYKPRLDAEVEDILNEYKKASD